ncbi:MAG TPA: ATP phosphoribosyltransferase, partial [Methylotenera sp.]|nr:ATP phosphoribosyltransferase [Methylotenera sp.]
EEIGDISSRLVVNQASFKLNRTHLKPIIESFSAAIQGATK